MNRYTFAVGIGAVRTVTVKAPDLETAMDKAEAELDKRAEKKNVEPPVAWTINLLRMENESLVRFMKRNRKDD